MGSPTKIDCSYLSPEVKISDRLEAATKIYSCNILMSGQFYDLLSDHIKVSVNSGPSPHTHKASPHSTTTTTTHPPLHTLSHPHPLSSPHPFLNPLSQVGIRLIDHVTLKGGVKPFRIYGDDRSNLWQMNPKLVDIYGQGRV